MIKSRSYNTVPGANRMFHPSLNGVRVLGVQRNGMQLTRVALFTTPVNDQFAFGISSVYVDPNNVFNPLEKIWVLYEI